MNPYILELFSFQGKKDRWPFFWQPLVVAFAVVAAIVLAFQINEALGIIVSIPGAVIAMWVGLANLTKRFRAIEWDVTTAWAAYVGITIITNLMMSSTEPGLILIGAMGSLAYWGVIQFTPTKGNEND